MIESILALSLIINILLFWYTRNTLSNLLYLSENLGSLYELIDDFATHLQAVYELERFYGDQTLGNLLEHANALKEVLDQYEDIFLLTGPTEEEAQEESDDEEEA